MPAQRTSSTKPSRSINYNDITLHFWPFRILWDYTFNFCYAARGDGEEGRQRGEWGVRSQVKAHPSPGIEPAPILYIDDGPAHCSLPILWYKASPLLKLHSSYWTDPLVSPPQGLGSTHLFILLKEYSRASQEEHFTQGISIAQNFILLEWGQTICSCCVRYRAGQPTCWSTSRCRLGQPTSSSSCKVGQNTISSSCKVGQNTSSSSCKVGQNTSSSSYKVGHNTSSSSCKVGQTTSSSFSRYRA